jgi:hypothetical protein
MAHIKQFASRRVQYWLGYLTERTGGSVVLWDPTYQPESDEHVYLYHFHRREIVAYTKSIVRAKLQALHGVHKDFVNTVINEYELCRQHLKTPMAYEYWRQQDKYPTTSRRMGDDQALDRDISVYDESPSLEREIWEDADYAAKNEESGWFYADSENDEVNNIIDPNTKND